MDVSTDVLTVLSGVKIAGLNLTIEGQIDRKLYEKTNKVLEAAGGRWNRKAKAHVFSSDPTEVIDRILVTGAILSARDEFGFFASPPEVVAEVVARAELRPEHRVLEPSAGHGAIAIEASKVCDVDCIEILPTNVEVLLRLRKQAGTFASHSLVSQGDFLRMTPQRNYDRVLMNPPFARQADVRHVWHALRWLKPEGMLVSVMAAGVTFRQDRTSTDFRDLVERTGGSIEPLPDGAFKASGTNVRTVLVTIPGSE